MMRFGRADAGNRRQMNLRRLYQLLGALSKARLRGARFSATPCEGHSASASDRYRFQRDSAVSCALINLAGVYFMGHFMLLHD
jgi:hypothetical protein